MNKILFAGIASLLMLGSCKPKEEEKEEQATFTISIPQVEDTYATKNYVADLRSQKNIEIRAQEKGFLEKVFVEEGQNVHAGQVMFKIMPAIYQSEVMKAKAEAEQASIELQNATKLANNNIVSKNEKAMAKAKLDAATAELHAAELHLSFTTIMAPFSGVINRLPLKIGSLVEEGDLLTSLSDNSNIYAYFNVSEPEYLNYQLHKDEVSKQPISLILANGQMFTQKGFVRNIEGEFNQETGSIAFRAVFPNENALLRNGQTGQVQMKIPLTNAMVIPQKSTYELQDRKYIFVIDKNNVAHSRLIKISPYDLQDIYVIESGLNPNEKYLVEGADKVKDGQKLKVVYKDPKAVMNSLQFTAN